MRNLAIIPARGGSKGLVGKNIREMAGKPLIAWSIEQAREASCVDKVVVSTDDPAIAEVAHKFGAEVPFLRPAALATDEAATEPVLKHALNWYADEGLDFDAVTLLQPTSPLRRHGSIDAAFRQFEREGADSLLSVCVNHHFFWRKSPAVEALYDYGRRPRRQDIPPTERWFRENGSLYISLTDAFLKSGNRLSGKITMFEMADEEGWEIDSEIDFVLMEKLFSWSGMC